MPQRSKQRVLSLDGGGTWSIVQVEALAHLYTPETRGHRILQDFDYAVANSGGSIVLGGLLLNASLREIQQKFDDLRVRTALFSTVSPWLGGAWFRLFRRVAGGPRFSTAEKRIHLLKIFDEFAYANGIRSQALADLAAAVGGNFQFTIIGYDYRRDRAKYFRSNAQSAAANPSRTPPAPGLPGTPDLIDAVHASSTAPVHFFDRAAESFNPRLKDELFWDGAVTGQNNPVVSGVIEALANGAERDSIVVLAIGTGGNALPPALVRDPAWQIENHVKRASAEIGKLGRAVIGDPPDHASFVAHMMLTGRLPQHGGARNDSPIVRISPLVGPYPSPDGGITWPWPEGLQPPERRRIIDLDMAAVSPEDFGMVQQLATDWINGRIRNQPIRMGSDLVCDLGDETFGEAVARWKAIS